LVDSIRGSVERFQAGTPPADDITIVAIGRQERAIRRRGAVGFAVGGPSPGGRAAG
jgi:hypothetical protein